MFSVLIVASPPLVLALRLFQVESSKSFAYSATVLLLCGTFASCQRQSLTATLRSGTVGTNVSGSWQLGSPLPTPRIFPVPSMAKLILFCATGTTRPCASSAETVNTATSSPSALIVLRSGVSWIGAASPVVSTFVSAIMFPAASKPFALKVPGAYFTFHVRCEFGFMVCLPSDAPFKNSFTCLQLLSGSPRISWPSLPGQFQCGSRWSTVFVVHHDLRSEE